jgi:hypothetical protein
MSGYNLGNKKFSVSDIIILMVDICTIFYLFFFFILIILIAFGII